MPARASSAAPSSPHPTSPLARAFFSPWHPGSKPTYPLSHSSALHRCSPCRYRFCRRYFHRSAAADAAAPALTSTPVPPSAAPADGATGTTRFLPHSQHASWRIDLLLCVQRRPVVVDVCVTRSFQKRVGPGRRASLRQGVWCCAVNSYLPFAGVACRRGGGCCAKRIGCHSEWCSTGCTLCMATGAAYRRWLTACLVDIMHLIRSKVCKSLG